MPEPAPSAPDAAAARSWVWHATVESREAGKVSVLACVETVVAVALYWWIAIRWDTHWPLLSSVFIAPLLLLRSPESMKLGVRWFLRDWFGFEDYEEWSRARRWLWLGGVAVVSGMATYALASWLCGLWLVGQVGWALLGWSALIGCLSVVFAVLIASASAGVIAFGSEDAANSQTMAGLIAGLIAILGLGLDVRMDARLGLSLGTMVGLVAGMGLRLDVALDVAAGLGLGMGLGMSLRSLVFRVAATLIFLRKCRHRK